MITVYSVIWAIINCSLMALILMLLRRNTHFLRKYGTSSLILLTFCCTVRMLFPLEFPNFQFVIPDKHIMPLIQGSYDRYRHFLKISPLIIGFWAVGTVLFILIYFCRYFLVQKNIRSNAVPAEEHITKIMHDLDPECPIKVFISPDISVPITAGIKKPAIYLTEQIYDSQNLYYILLHEYNHWKRKDIWKKICLYSFSSIMWWNPFSYILRNEFIQILEFRCDSSLCKNLTPQEETEYLKTLYQTQAFLSLHNKRYKSSSTTMEFIGTRKNARSTLKQRFALLIYGNEKGHRGMKSILILAVCFWMLASYYFLPQPYYAPVMPDGDEMVSYDDISIKEIDDDTYDLYIKGTTDYPEKSFSINDKNNDDKHHFNYSANNKHPFYNKLLTSIKKYLRKAKIYIKNIF